MSDDSLVPTTRSYHLAEVIGRGGFGTVYRAEMRGAGGFVKSVALKMLATENREFLARLRDEARMLGLLRHRAIVQVDDLVRVGGRWAVVMEYHEGVSLDVLKRPMPLSAALEIVAEVAEALDVAYDRPVRDGKPLRLLHRDVKPSNIHVSSDGTVTLLDFGVARADFAAREVQSRAVLVGTPAYMAPERFHLVERHEGDVFALAVTLVELVCGPVDVPARGDATVHARRVESLMQPFAERAMDDEVVAWVASCLAWDPESRPSAAKVAASARTFRASIGEPTLRAWAVAAVPEAMAQRDPEPDGLTGTLLEEESALDVGATFVAEDDPAVRRTPPRRGCLGPVALVGCVVLGFGGLVGAASLGALFVGWNSVMASTLEDGFVEMADRLDLAAPSAPRDRLRGALKRGGLAARAGKVGLWEFSSFETRFDAALRDGRITEAESRSLSGQIEEMARS